MLQERWNPSAADPNATALLILKKPKEKENNAEVPYYPNEL